MGVRTDTNTDTDTDTEEAPAPHSCCPLYHEAIELIGRRWTGAILSVLLDGPMRFSEIGHAVPELSDRLLSERMKELERRGIVERTVHRGPPVKVEYRLSSMGLALEPALGELQRWAKRWLGDHPADPGPSADLGPSADPGPSTDTPPAAHPAAAAAGTAPPLAS